VLLVRGDDHVNWIKLDASNVSNSTIVRVWVFAIAKGTV